jgi:two-component system, sensor histidine kinase and response regulator
MLFEPNVLAAYDVDDLVGRLIAMFAEDAPRLARMVVEATDSEARARAAHALRGCALSLGASDLAAACATIETQARANETVDVDASLVASLDALVASTCHALDAHWSARQREPL